MRRLQSLVVRLGKGFGNGAGLRLIGPELLSANVRADRRHVLRFGRPARPTTHLVADLALGPDPILVVAHAVTFVSTLAKTAHVILLMFHVESSGPSD